MVSCSSCITVCEPGTILDLAESLTMATQGAHGERPDICYMFGYRVTGAI